MSNVIMVDEQNGGDIKWVYTNLDDDIEYVKYEKHRPRTVRIKEQTGRPVNYFYIEDIPNLVKALEAAYSHSRSFSGDDK